MNYNMILTDKPPDLSLTDNVSGWDKLAGTGSINERCIACPKNTETEYIPGIQHLLGFGSLLADRESQRAISRSASSSVILLRNFHSRSECHEDGLQCGTSLFATRLS
jgi:hypothetical protein